MVFPPKQKLTKTTTAKKDGTKSKVTASKAKKAAPKKKMQKLRTSITPGTILILLVGRHRGKRVVFLKQLPKSGLLLVSGPLKINNTPIRRVAQAFVIATKTKLDISKVQIPEHINDDYFRKIKEKGDKSKAGIFATSENKIYTVSEQRKTDQKTVDAGIVAAIRAHADKKYLFGYLGSRFSLGKRDYPHKLVF